jgi:multidrug efflux pump subunit AcrA (membrane-fusion protein)
LCKSNFFITSVCIPKCESSLPAPVSGTVISRSVNPGEVIAADKELLRVSDLSSVWVDTQVYEKDLGKIRIRSGASVTSEAYPGRLFRGQVSYIDPVIDQTTRTAQVRVEHVGGPSPRSIHIRRTLRGWDCRAR